MDDAVYRDLFESAPDGIIIVDQSGRIQMLNAQVQQMFGYTEAELLGRPVEVLVPARLRSVHTLHRGAYTDHPRTRPMGAGLQLMAKRKDGTEFPVEISLSPVTMNNATLVTAVVRDNTERRRSEDAIRSQAQLLDLAQDAIIMLNRERQVQYWNSGAEFTYGWTAEEALGRSIDELLHTESAAPAAEVTHALDSNGSWEGELSQTRQDGVRIDVASRMVVQRAPTGAIAAIMQIDRDITERRQLERERLLIESDRQQDRARIGMDLHDGIIQSIYAVSLGLEAVADDIAKDPQSAQNGLDLAMDQLAEVIRDVRSYIFELKPSRFSADLGASFREMVDEFARATSMRVDAQIDETLPALDDDERAMLFHIAREALTNARKHARSSYVRLALTNSGGAVKLEVEDDGAGFDVNDRRRENQFGLRNMASRASAAGATLEIKSGPGEGTRIRVSLPLEERINS